MNIRTVYDRWLRITYWPRKRKYLKRMLAMTTEQARDRGLKYLVALEVCEHYGYTKDWCEALGWTVTRVTDAGVVISASDPCVVTAAHKLRAYHRLSETKPKRLWIKSLAYTLDTRPKRRQNG